MRKVATALLLACGVARAHAASETVLDLLKLAVLGDPAGGWAFGAGRGSAGPALGGFNTGFRVREDGALVAHAPEAEILVHLPAGGAAWRLTADVVSRRKGPCTLFANGRRVGRALLGTSRRTLDFEIPSGALRAGDNHLTFAFHGGRVRGRLLRRRLLRQKPMSEPVRATFERIELRPTRAPAEEAVSVYAEIPAGAVLVGRGAGQGRIAARVQVDGSEVREVVSHAVASEVAVRAPLEAFAGRVARITLASTGSAAWKEARFEAPARAPVEAAFRPRNVILWIVDALRADKLGCYNPASRVRTPNFDAFARQGVLFRKAVAQSSHSKPASASLLTGHYPASHGASRHKDRLRTDVPLLSELFQKGGYATAGFAANGFIGKPHGFVRGFDAFRNLLREGKPAKTPYLFHDVRRWLSQKRSKPFFLYVHTVDPHVPYNPPRHFLALYWRGRYRGPLIPRRSGHQLDDARAGRFRVGPTDRRFAEALYDGEVTVADYYFGKLLDLLDELGLAKDTLVVVSADHGEEFWEHGQPGHGHSLYNELVRVPFLLGPAPPPLAGRTVEGDVEMVDLAPTVLDLAGLPIPAEIQGHSLVPAIRAEPLLSAPAFAVHEGRIASAQAGRWKYVVYRGGAERVFDLSRDPGEHRDLSEKAPIVRRWLRGLLAEWLHRQGTWRKTRDGILGRPR
jgi:arylsulfatase A-like enzyme